MGTILNLYVPSIGQKLKLISDWTFTLHAESRNEKFGEKLGYKYFSYDFLTNNRAHTYKPVWVPKDVYEQFENFQIDRWSYDQEKIYELYKENITRCQDILVAILPAGTILTVARIYIRQGLSSYDSMTFSINSHPNKKIKGRFWAKLKEVNTIMCETDI